MPWRASSNEQRESAVHEAFAGELDLGLGGVPVCLLIIHIDTAGRAFHDEWVGGTGQGGGMKA